jgi:hypothetical protein
VAQRRTPAAQFGFRRPSPARASTMVAEHCTYSPWLAAASQSQVSAISARAEAIAAASAPVGSQSAAVAGRTTNIAAASAAVRRSVVAGRGMGPRVFGHVVANDRGSRADPNASGSRRSIVAARRCRGV